MKTIRIAAASCCLLSASIAFAQSDAQVSGTVTDQTGATVVGATVTALDTTTGVSTPVTTNGAGVYTMPGLLPGRYNFTAEFPGFQKSVTAGVILETGSVLTLNMNLQVGASTQTVEVSAQASEVTTTSSNVATVIDGKRLLDLPLNGRSSYSLVLTQPGVVDSSQWYVNGTQVAATNVTMDGITNMDQYYAGGTGYLYVNISSVDRVQEVQVVTSPADAELGRGSGQIQLTTRAGTSRYQGSAYEELRNKVFNANTFFNNAAGSYPSGAPLNPISNLNKHVYGIRFGGPFPKYLKGKLFFNGITEPQRETFSTSVNQTVYTASARQGIFRFYPGATNGNAQSLVPTVDLSGNPVQPAAATGPLQSVSVLGRDPNRLAPDPTGVMQHVLGYMPLPNNFLIGDGLNTAGYTWLRPGSDTYGLYEGRIDYNISEKQRLMLRLSESSYAAFTSEPPNYPGVPWGSNPGEYTNYGVALTSILRPNLLNELRLGILRPRGGIVVQYDPYNLTGGGASIANRDKVTNFLPVINGVGAPVYLAGVTSPYGTAAPGDFINPTYQYGDNLTWIKGKHSFKGGVQVRFISSSGYPFSVAQIPPLVNIGQPAATPVSNIATGPNPIAGIGANATAANNLLFNLTGSVASATELNISTGGKNPVFVPGLTPYRSWHQNEMDWFFKDDWKVTPSLTLNLGVRWELYLPPVEINGKGIAPVGGSAGLFGISGTNLGALFNPYATGGSPSVVQGIGPNTLHPDIPFYNTDFKNYSPNVGLAWNLPGTGIWKWISGGPNKMTIRMGYGIGYQHIPIALANTVSGLNQGAAEIDTETTATSISDLVLPVPAAGTPLAPVPLTGPGSHTNSLYAYDSNLRVPYTQNYNVTIARALTNSIVMTVAFVGSKSSKLIRTVDTNETNIYENGLLSAFNTVAAGGDSPLMNRIFSTNYAAVAAAGSGSNYVRTNSATNGFLANNNPGGLANYINTTTSLSGVAGGLLANAGLPLNFIVANPQFLHTYLTGNFANSTYNSLQVQIAKRFAQGFSIQSSYVWSHALGDNPGDSPSFSYNYRTLRNESLDKGPLSFDYQQVYRINGLYELPFGKGKLIGRNSNGLLDRIIGGFELGAIGFAQSGQPLTLIGQNTINNTTGYSGAGTLLPYNAFIGYSAVQVGALPNAAVTKTNNGVLYFSGLTQISDPSIANLNGAALQRLSTLLAIAGPNGNPILVNAAPGVLSPLQQGTLRGPGSKGLNVNLIKRIRINERFVFQIGATAQNITNTPIFGSPNTNINSTSFGRITGTTGTYPSRLIVLQGRLNF